VPLGVHYTLSRMHLDLRAILDALDRRLLEQPHAQRLCRRRLAECQIQRVQVARPHVQQAAEVTLRAHHRDQVGT